MIIFSDPMTRRGGGQVVLEELLRRSAAQLHDIRLAMPAEGREQIAVPEEVRAADDVAGLLPITEDVSQPIVFVSTVTRGYPADLLEVRKLRRRGHQIISVAIMHNYPETPAKTVATKLFLRQFDFAIAVEPGLARLCKNAIIPPWLAPVSNDSEKTDGASAFTGEVKSFARPDPSKGLDLLARIYPRLEAAGLTCRVALGTALQDHVKYVSHLRSSLSPWLERSPRSASWINPGDLFLVPSIAGETTCLAAQEAILRGAFVITSRVGVLPYLSPELTSHVTTVTGDPNEMADAALRAARLSPEDFARRVLRGQRMIAERSGEWYEYTISRLREWSRP
ncbi:glycosyltransferase [Pseudoclavibacter sp. CFCC 13796]|nr:glycosyltransferase [Pseudoclavibacter sp. CFCC 13796]